MRRTFEFEKGWQNTTVKIAMVAVSLIIAMIVLEIALRLSGFEPHRPIGILLEKNPEFGHSLIDSAKQVMATSEARFLVTITNGRRNIPDQAGAPDDAKTSVYAVGDSFCFGQAVDDKHVWINLLAKSIGSSHKLYFDNLGVPGYGPKQYHLTIEKLPRDLGQAVVIYLFFIGNDITIERLGDFRQNIDEPGTEHLSSSLKLLRWFGYHSAAAWSIFAVAVSYRGQHNELGVFKSKRDFENFKRDCPNWNNTVALVSESLKTVERRGGKTLLVVIPYGKQYDNKEGETVGRYIGNHFSSAIKKRVRNTAILDLSQHMQFGQQLLFRGFGHFNIRGNQWLAELIEPLLILTLTKNRPSSDGRRADRD